MKKIGSGLEKCLFPESHRLYLCFKLDLLARWLETPGTTSVVVFTRQKACFCYPWPQSTNKHLFLNLHNSVQLSEAVTSARLGLASLGVSSSHPKQDRLCTAHLFIVPLQHSGSSSVQITESFSTNHAEPVIAFFFSSLFEGLYSGT